MVTKNLYLYDFNIICLTFFIGFLIAIIFLLLSYLLTFKEKSYLERDKISSYECGFEPFSDSRINFNIHFYIIAILFLIFDLEVMFLVPLILSLESLNIFGFFNMLFFLFILTLGFIYEWKLGALQFNSLY